MNDDQLSNVLKARKELDDLGVKYEMRNDTVKNVAKIKLKTGKYIILCLYNKTVRTGNKPAVPYKNILNFCKKNRLEIA